MGNNDLERFSRLERFNRAVDEVLRPWGCDVPRVSPEDWALTPEQKGILRQQVDKGLDMLNAPDTKTMWARIDALPETHAVIWDGPEDRMHLDDYPPRLVFTDLNGDRYEVDLLTEVVRASEVREIGLSALRIDFRVKGGEIKTRYAAWSDACILVGGKEWRNAEG